ncbi:MAG TPA: hypothetical protein VEL71_04315 [Candidatus Dormibacteraeota bacterium]|nr:hypothetical protein [Candidatus Dormibacteraeota bacterium]
MIAVALVVQGIEEEYIMTLRGRRKHAPARWAHIDDKRITYPKI